MKKNNNPGGSSKPGGSAGPSSRGRPLNNGLLNQIGQGFQQIPRPSANPNYAHRGRGSGAFRLPFVRPHLGARGQGRGGQRTDVTASADDQTTRRYLGFKRLHALLTGEENHDAAIMVLHRNIKEWEELMDDKDKKLSDDLFLIIVNLLGEKVCVETILQINQIEIVRRTFGEGFATKLREFSSKMSLGLLSSIPALQNDNVIRVDTSKIRILHNLHKLFSFVALKLPTTATDHVLPHLHTVFGGIGICLLSTDSEAAELEVLQNEFKDLLAHVGSLVKKKTENDGSATRPGKFKFSFTAREEEMLHKMAPPDDFREISIIPTIEDITSMQDTFLRTNKRQGAYIDANHYLDVQFRLLREDFLRPLKGGIQDFLRNRHDYLSKKKKMPMGNVRIYPSVRITNVRLVRESLTYCLQLSDDISKKVKWEKSKRLLQGSLLVLTADNFHSAFFAVVAKRDPDELRMKGEFGVVWEGLPPVWDQQNEYLMMECEVYFEAYRHTLQILKELKLEKFPMSKFIVQGSADVCAPKYLADTDDQLNICGKYFSPLVGPWPSANDIGLDETQFAAFYAALTQEFAIIQGPPGTGKTFLGLKIAEVFLQNLEVWWSGQGPILVVCYTNHALDQFLEGIIEIMKRIDPEKDPALIRVGGRSKTPALDDYSLIRQRMAASKFKLYPQEYWFLKKEANSKVQDLQFERANIMADVGDLSNPDGIVNLESLGKPLYNKLETEFSKVLLDLMKKPGWYGIRDFVFRIRKTAFNERWQLNAWFGALGEPSTQQVDRNPQPSTSKQVDEVDFDDDEDYDLNELMENRIFETVQMEVDSNFAGRQKKLEYLPLASVTEIEQKLNDNFVKIAKVDQETSSNSDKETKRNQIYKQSEILENRLRFLKLLFQAHHNGRLRLPAVDTLLKPPHDVEDEYAYFDRMYIAQKWAIYFYVLRRARVLKANEVKPVEAELIEAQKTLQQVQRQGDGYLLQRTKVVGMTTTGAAKYNDLLRMMRSKIVIVEEAAEVLEAHIVTCISEKCEHLILIGDHQQLRPSTTVYELSTKYNLDISLFERMLNNNLNCHKLKMQHRMRPEIRDLIVGTIYKELEDSPSVRNYPDVEGTEKNLFFISHTELEKSEADSMSKSNVHEAKLLASFCRYLIQQGYSTDQITILTTYTGQMFLLRKELSVFPGCKGVRITVVDNFQGEENDIILLSLVRSNEKQQAGFLKTDNRICVALSRAKHGLYISGNLDMLASTSGTWQQIKEKLGARDECGPKLGLKCQIHGTLTEVEDWKDFAKVPEGGCLQMCGSMLKCGHSCKSVCHIQDKDHTEYKCRLSCQKTCANQHLCASMCFEQCPRCPVLMNKTLPCLHEKQLMCSVPVDSVKCMVQVEKQLPCGHMALMACHNDPTAYSCRIKVTKRLPCSHDKNDIECHVDAASITCKTNVLKTLIPCGHEQETLCNISPETVKCEAMVSKKFPDCGHEVQLKCQQLKVGNIYCKSQCLVRLECGHSCTKTCHLGSDPNHLEYECRKECGRTCVNGHNCATKHKCCQECPPCKTIIEKTMQCRIHKAELECCVDIKDAECVFPCELRLPLCGHQCQKLCFQPCEPCMVLVPKKAPCGHTHQTECCNEARRENCDVLVQPLLRSSCRHDTLVPCRLQSTILPEDAVKYCQEKCNFSFETEGPEGCDHVCKGTCAECHQGRLHKKCQEKCGKELVCGHICSFPCSKACPPCQQKCDLKCDHSECRRPCGEPCTLCNEKCSWKCEHQKCNKLCREPCSRPRCEVPCPKILKCGHPCVGYCGEPCSPLCRICDKEELTEVFFGNEDEEDARFIYLEDCKHSIEATGLDYYMLDSVKMGSIQAKACPKCKTTIRHSKRYGNLLRSQLKDVINVKKKLFGNPNKVKKQQNDALRELNQNSRTWEMTLPVVKKFIFDKLANVVQANKNARNGPKTDRVVHKKVDEPSMASIELITKHGKDVLEVIHTKDPVVAYELSPQLRDELIRRYQDLFALLLKRELPLSDAEVRDFDREFDRLFDLKQAYLRRSCERFTNGHPTAQPLYDKAIEIILAPKVYTKEMKKAFQNFLAGIDHSIKTGLGISDRERRDILKAMDMARGHWFKCPNGHIYAITECGGAMEEGTCNECGARIGGGNHTLRRDNDLAGEMDGAEVPLYPTMLMR